MSVVGITLAARTALAAAITQGGLTCRKYDTWDIQDGSLATLGLVRWNLSETPDQGYGFRSIVLPVLVYQVVDGSIDSSLAYQEANVEKVINGLGRDRKLGGAVPDSEIVSDVTQEYYRVAGGQAYSVVTFDVQLDLFPNVGS